jgi:hypothetical protein
MPLPKKFITKGSLLMISGMLIFLVYAIVFLLFGLFAEGFELGIPTLNGVTPAELYAINPAIIAYMKHLYVAISAFILSTGIAVITIVWCGVQRGYWWAWWAAMISPIVALIFILSFDYAGTIRHNWVAHSGPIYLGIFIFVIGGLNTFMTLAQGEIKPKIKALKGKTKEKEVLMITNIPKFNYKYQN